MSKVEEMYKVIGFEPEIVPRYSLNCEYYEVDKGYPPFTMEKQLKLIQLLSQQCDLTISHFSKYEFTHFDGINQVKVKRKSFEEALAELVVKYWKELSVLEQTKIKEILK